MDRDFADYRPRIAALPRDKRDILSARLNGVRADAAVSKRSDPSASRLVACVVVQPGVPPAAGELHKFAGARLPDFMVPHRFIVVDSLPRLPNGKIDRGALRSVENETGQPRDADFAAPGNPGEEILARIWSDVLGLDSVSVHDDFFEMGGDSLLSIRILARANREGLKISPDRFFAQPTIAEQAAAAGSVTAIVAEQGIVTGEAPLIPIQHWFFERVPVDPHHWNQSYLFSITQAIELIDLERALQKVLLHHDALRLQFGRKDDVWRQRLSDAGNAPPVSRFDLSGLTALEQQQEIVEIANDLNKDLRIEKAPLLRAALLKTASDEDDLFLVIAHHLVMDALSWTIVLEDLETVCGQAGKGVPLELPAKTSSWKQWATRLRDYAQTDRAKDEFAYWEHPGANDDHALPLDFPPGATDIAPDNRMAGAHTLSTSLDLAATATLVHELPRRFNAQINDALLTALVRSICAWSGRDSLCLDVEGHGREAMFEDTDISRTVGWLTSVYPVRLDLAAEGDPGVQMTATKERLRQVPRHGIGYGLLRELCTDDEISTALRSAPRRQLCFNYLGQIARHTDPGRLFQLLDADCGVTRSPRGLRAYVLDVNAKILGGRLQIDWTYNRELHLARTIETVAQAFLQVLRDLVDFCRTHEGGMFTPSDFPLAGLDQAGFDGLSALLDGIDKDHGDGPD